MIGIGIGVPFSFSSPIDANAQTIYNRIIADGGVSNLTRLNFFVKGLKSIYGDLANVPVCYDAHWIGYKLGSGTGATAGQAAAKLYSLTVAGDAVQSTAASQPLLLAHNGVSSDNYYYAVPTTGNYCLSSLSYNTSDWDVEFKINGKYASAQDRVVSTRTSGNGTTVTVNATSINLEYSIATVFYVATALVTNTNDVDYTIRVTRNSTTGAVTFIRNGVTLTTTGVQLLGTLDGVSNLIEINGCLAGVQAINAKIYYCNLYIAGNIVRNFNPATYNASTSQTAWTSATGEVWTINTGTATTGYKGVLVDRTIVQSDKIDDAMASGTLASRQYFTSYSAHRFFSYTGNQTVYAGSTNSHLLYTGVSSQTAYNGINLGSGNLSILTNVATIDFNIFGNSKIRINAGSDTIGDAGTQPSTDCKLFVYGATNFGNVILNTLIQTNSINTNAQKTATYNLIRSLNNNAF